MVRCIRVEEDTTEFRGESEPTIYIASFVEEDYDKSGVMFHKYKSSYRKPKHPFKVGKHYSHKAIIAIKQ